MAAQRYNQQGGSIGGTATHDEVKGDLLQKGPVEGDDDAAA